ncbi:acid protease [Aspergillus sclerotioniger CBS 115572]|uniref:Acid protease n=1 Tax=Aspergillus sclerotioniger CBS 115572 TaxID=1450535 RepID=A0A317W0L3_9EURO|nr:acid protease [Aspergillus sclerotioniger CBS 115572]PWY79525.1 acid protease [Aspergillus sclerotioniger CBS 115572]
MRLFSYTATWCGLFLYAIATSTSLPSRESSAVSFPLRHPPNGPTNKRDIPLAVEGLVTIWGNNYWLKASFGTPPQTLGFILDFEPSNLEVIVSNGMGVPCSKDTYCELFGSFNTNESTTFHTLTYTEFIQTGDKYAYTDTFTVRDQVVKAMPVELFNIEEDSANALGLSPTNISFPYLLVDRGLTTSPSFSLCGDGGGTNQASILFGAVNTAKFDGPLQAFSLQGSHNTVSFQTDSLQLLTESNNTATEPARYTFPPTNLTLEPRSAYSYLPNTTLQHLYTDLNITMVELANDSPESSVLECSRQYTEKHTISLMIGNMTFSVPWDELFIPWTTDGLCQLAIQPITPGAYASGRGQLGVPFLRRMYIAIDYDNMFVGVAPLKQNPGSDNIVEIGTGPEIPDAVGEWPASVTAYTPAPTRTSTGGPVTRTSTGGVARGTGLLAKRELSLVVGFAGLALSQGI